MKTHYQTSGAVLDCISSLLHPISFWNISIVMPYTWIIMINLPFVDSFPDSVNANPYNILLDIYYYHSFIDGDGAVRGPI